MRWQIRTGLRRDPAIALPQSTDEVTKRHEDSGHKWGRGEDKTDNPVASGVKRRLCDCFERSLPGSLDHERRALLDVVAGPQPPEPPDGFTGTAENHCREQPPEAVLDHPVYMGHYAQSACTTSNVGILQLTEGNGE